MKLLTIKTLLLLVVVSAGLIGCKIEVDVTGDGEVNSGTSTNIDNCTETGGDCTHEYVTDPANCTDPLNCTVVTTTITETLVATPEEGENFSGWGGTCAGAGECGKEITTADANDTTTWNITADFEPDPDPQDASYTYNYLGQRVSKTVGTLTTWFTYRKDGKLAREYDTNGYSRIYIYTVNELTAIHEYDGTDEMVYFPVKDHLGQPKSLLAIDETLSQERYGTPFGETYSEYKLSGVGEQNLRFPGQYYDEETGFHQNWFRDYGSDIGRYYQPDPLGLYDGMNPYLYAGGNPIMYVDPMGLKKKKPKPRDLMEDICLEDGETCQEMINRKHKQCVEMKGGDACRANQGALHSLCTADAVEPCDEEDSTDNGQGGGSQQEQPRPPKPSSFTDDAGCKWDYKWNDYGFWEIYRLNCGGDTASTAPSGSGMAGSCPSYSSPPETGCEYVPNLQGGYDAVCPL